MSVRARPRAWGFIRENIHKIHHCQAVHAKAVISKSLALMGSANLTGYGILGRTEMGILIDEPCLVAEIGAWFDGLWQQTSPPIADETSAFVQWLDEEAGKAPSRRQKFSLSNTGKKVRARLADLQTDAHTKPNREGSPLDLGAMAQILVAQERKHYDSIEHAIEAAIDTLTAGYSFKLGEVVAQVKTGFESASYREVYLLLLQHCANHVRSVFEESTQNRLVLSEGRFSQSSRESILDALAIFDVFLVHIIRHLDFDVARWLPVEERIYAETGIVGRDQVILIAELLDCGLLDMEDMAGELPRYRLVSEFDWEGRYRLFSQARYAWLALRNKPISKEAHQTSYDADQLGTASETDVPVQYKISDEISDDSSSWTELKRDQAKGKVEHLRELDRVAQERREKIDNVMAHILRRLFAGEVIEATSPKNLAEQLARETKVGHLLIRKILESGSPYPHIVNMSNDRQKNVRRLMVNGAISWRDLESYPLTQAVCEQFLMP